MERVYKVVVKECTTSDGKKKFFAFALIHPESKRKIDLRFKLEAVNYKVLEKTGKHKVVIDDNKLSYTEAYEYPRIYCEDIERLADEDEEVSAETIF